MTGLVSKFILKIFGWRITRGLPEGLEKCVLIVAPHTSNYDFIIGRLAFYALGVKVKFLIKKEVFRYGGSLIFKPLGGIPVDRSKSNHMVSYIAEQFKKKNKLCVIITPEGRRSLNTRWRKGFYYIALKSDVPIALGVLDYKYKTAGIEEVLYPGGDFEKDFAFIEEFYRGRNARFPENYNLSDMDMK